MVRDTLGRAAGWLAPNFLSIYGGQRVTCFRSVLHKSQLLTGSLDACLEMCRSHSLKEKRLLNLTTSARTVEFVLKRLCPEILDSYNGHHVTWCTDCSVPSPCRKLTTVTVS